MVSNATGGCCFAFGFGELMKPCCLIAEVVEDRSLCEQHEEIVGGMTGFTLGECPRTPQEANSMIEDNVTVKISSGDKSAPLLGDSAPTENSPAEEGAQAGG